MRYENKKAKGRKQPPEQPDITECNHEPSLSLFGSFPTT
jgi:hypothetical protein